MDQKGKGQEELKMPNNLRKKMRGKSIMGLDFSKFDDSDEEEIPELVDSEEKIIEEKPFKKASKRGKSKRQVKSGKKTRKQVRFQ